MMDEYIDYLKQDACEPIEFLVSVQHLDMSTNYGADSDKAIKI